MLGIIQIHQFVGLEVRKNFAIVKEFEKLKNQTSTQWKDESENIVRRAPMETRELEGSKNETRFGSISLESFHCNPIEIGRA